MKKHIVVFAVVVAVAFAPMNAQACWFSNTANATFNSSSNWTWGNFAGGTNASWVDNESACGYTLAWAKMSPAGAMITSDSFSGGTGASHALQFTAYVPNYTSATAIYDHIRIRVDDDLGRSEEFYAYFTNMTSCNYTFFFNLSNNYSGRTVTITLKKSQYSSMTAYVDNAYLFYYVC